MEERDYDYQIVDGTKTTVQMKLNQWKHLYQLNILSMQITEGAGSVFYHILLMRIKHEAKRPAVCTDAEIPEGTTAKSDTRVGKLPWEE